MYRCETCGFVFLWPLPAEEELRRYYISETYRREYADASVDERYRTDLNEARTRVSRLLKLLTPDARLLEIGSGSGAFLDSVKPYVGYVQGVEPDQASRTWIKEHLGMKVSRDLAELAGEGYYFDLIVSFHVLEHILEPVEFLKRLSQLLLPEGKLVVEVPNIDDVLVSVYRVSAYLGFYHQKAHLSYFSKSTLALALEKAGFSGEIVGIQRYDLSNHITWMLKGKPGGMGRYNSVLGPSVNAAYADSLIRSGCSDTILAIAGKTDLEQGIG